MYRLFIMNPVRLVIPNNLKNSWVLITIAKPTIFEVRLYSQAKISTLFSLLFKAIKLNQGNKDGGSEIVKFSAEKTCQVYTVGLT